MSRVRRSWELSPGAEKLVDPLDHSGVFIVNQRGEPFRLVWIAATRSFFK